MKKTENRTVEEKFTLEQAREEIKAKAEAEAEDRKVRVNEFIKLIQEAEMKTNCYLQVDFNSPLNNIKLTALSKT